ALRPYLASLGVEPERLQLAWISAAEGEKFASVIKEIVEAVKKLGPIDRTKLRYWEAERQKAEA
ncbi:MAG: hydrogenase iron-sulfur subunit, partial [Actinobacteria bacterium]|nr:hydrogenase iron-sulfur subunit [Actinomycetota bacterium]